MARFHNNHVWLVATLILWRCLDLWKMYANYTYGKARREFGKQCRFSKIGPTVLENLMPDPNLRKPWLLKNLVNQSTGNSVEWSLHEVNTLRVEYVDRGILHAEGGWPKDVNMDDPEQVVRYRKKAEKEETYLQSVIQMATLAEHFIKQNNAVDVYQPYFTEPDCQWPKTLAPSYQTVAVILDPIEPARPVQHISWSPEQGTQVAISYADIRYQMADPLCNADSFVFDIEDPTVPCFTAESPRPIVTLEFNYRDGQCLAGGLNTGQVAHWDMRKGPAAVAVSDVRASHRDPVRSVYWIHSKTNTEFYSGSSDGQVMWWDTRKLTEPTEVLMLDLLLTENTEEPEWIRWSRSHGVASMDYDPLIPIRLMIGTETGLVFNGNRKGKTISEKISGIYNCHHGPVYSIQRNPMFLKNFLTVGDSQVKIWSEDVKDSPIMWTKHYDVRLTDGAWSESKPSVFYTTRADGCLDSWDILQRQTDPIITIQTSNIGLNCIRCHEGGELLAVGDEVGKTYVIKMNDWFTTPEKNDKALLTALFDRETKREKIIEGKIREQKLKTMTAKGDTEMAMKKLVEAENRVLHQAESEFEKLIDKINTQSSDDQYDNLDESENVEEEENTTTFKS